jgi:hypothetical protein
MKLYEETYIKKGDVDIRAEVVFIVSFFYIISIGLILFICIINLKYPYLI